MKQPTIHLVPGWAMTVADMDGLRQNLEPHAQAVGHSSGLDLEQLVPEEEPVVLLGWSMGGMQAIKYAIENPEWVQALILLSTAANFVAKGDGPGVPRAQHRAFTSAMRRNPEQTLTQFFSRVSRPHLVDSNRLRARTRAGLALDTKYLLEGLAYLGTVDLRADLARLSLPVLVIHGTLDEVIPCEAGAALAENIPESQWRTVPQGGHDLAETHPEWLASTIRDFMGSMEQVASTQDRPAS